MKRMFAIASFLALGLSACGGGADKWKSKYQKLIDEACACKDEQCFDAVSEKRRELRKEFREAYKDNRDKAKEIGEKLEPMDKKWNECRDKIRQAGEPAPTPAPSE